MWKLYFGFFACFVGSAIASADAIKITGPTNVKPFALVRLKTEGADAKAAIRWRITPSKGVDRATTPRGVLEFVAPPGTYEIEAEQIRLSPEGEVLVDGATTTVTIDPVRAPAPPATPPGEVAPPGAGKGKKDIRAAIGKLELGSGHCTATVIGPRRADGRWDVLTAAHCVKRIGEDATLRLKDGSTIGVKVSALDKRSDLCWMLTNSAEHADLPYGVLAKNAPVKGVRVWHAGYGIDKPGNTETGVVLAGPDANHVLTFELSVSPGDSGGPIVRFDTDEVVSAVCCTERLARVARMYGGSCERAAELRPRGAAIDDAPLPPRRMPPCPDDRCPGWLFCPPRGSADRWFFRFGVEGEFGHESTGVAGVPVPSHSVRGVHRKPHAYEGGR